jgi:hypothetical protein
MCQAEKKFLLRHTEDLEAVAISYASVTYLRCGNPSSQKICYNTS